MVFLYTSLEEWAKISVARCAKVIETYPKRLAAVIAAKGGSTIFLFQVVRQQNKENSKGGEYFRNPLCALPAQSCEIHGLGPNEFISID